MAPTPNTATAPPVAIADLPAESPPATLKVKRVKATGTAAPVAPVATASLAPVAALAQQNTLEPVVVKAKRGRAGRIENQTSSLRRKKADATVVAAPAPEPEDAASIQEEATCDICAEPFTSKLRKVITCPSCNQTVCSQCVQRYLLGIVDDPHCMHCKHGWPRSLLYKLLTKSFVDNDYAEQRAKLLWQREQSYLPEAQVRVERIREAEKIQATVCKDLEAKRRTIRTELDVFIKKVDELSAAKAKVDGALTRIYDNIAALRRGELPAADRVLDGTQKKTVERRQFIRKCTVEGCRGMLSSAWKCGVCDNYTCPECYATKGHDRDVAHTCTKEALELVAMLSKDTKPCPQCGEFIFHNGGCDQMWCTACHTPFSWSTLRIITTGNIHNPHYFQWRNTDGGPARAPGDIPCGGCPGPDFLERISRDYVAQDATTVKLREKIQAIYRIIAHCEDIELRAYRPDGDRDQAADHQLLIEYLLKSVDEPMVRARLQNRERRREVSAAIFGVIETLTNVGAEMLRGIAAFCSENRGTVEIKPNPKGTMTDEEHVVHLAEINKQNTVIRKQNADALERRNVHVLTQIPEFERLRRFINAALFEVSYYYGVAVPTIPDSWDRIRHDRITRRDTLEKLVTDVNSENLADSSDRHYTKGELSQFDHWRTSRAVEYNYPSSYQTQKLKNGKTVSLTCTTPNTYDPVKVATFNAEMTEIEKAKRKYYKIVKDLWRDVCKEICKEKNIKEILRYYDAGHFGVAPLTYFPSKDAAIKAFNDPFDAKLNAINHFNCIYEIIERINDYNKRVEKYNNNP